MIYFYILFLIIIFSETFKVGPQFRLGMFMHNAIKILKFTTNKLFNY